MQQRSPPDHCGFYEGLLRPIRDSLANRNTEVTVTIENPHLWLQLTFSPFTKNATIKDRVTNKEYLLPAAIITALEPKDGRENRDTHVEVALILRDIDKWLESNHIYNYGFYVPENTARIATNAAMALHELVCNNPAMVIEMEGRSTAAVTSRPPHPFSANLSAAEIVLLTQLAGAGNGQGPLAGVAFEEHGNGGWQVSVVAVRPAEWNS